MIVGDCEYGRMEPWQLGPTTRWPPTPWPPNFSSYSDLKAGLEQAIEEHPPFGEWLVPRLVVQCINGRTGLTDPVGYDAKKMFEVATAATPSDGENYIDSIERLKHAYVKDISERRFRAHLRRLRLERLLEEHMKPTPEEEEAIAKYDQALEKHKEREDLFQAAARAGAAVSRSNLSTAQPQEPEVLQIERMIKKALDGCVASSALPGDS